MNNSDNSDESEALVKRIDAIVDNRLGKAELTVTDTILRHIEESSRQATANARGELQTLLELDSTRRSRLSWLITIVVAALTYINTSNELENQLDRVKVYTEQHVKENSSITEANFLLSTIGANTRLALLNESSQPMPGITQAIMRDFDKAKNIHSVRYSKAFNGLLVTTVEQFARAALRPEINTLFETYEQEILSTQRLTTILIVHYGVDLVLRPDDPQFDAGLSLKNFEALEAVSDHADYPELPLLYRALFTHRHPGSNSARDLDSIIATIGLLNDRDRRSFLYEILKISGQQDSSPPDTVSVVLRESVRRWVMEHGDAISEALALDASNEFLNHVREGNVSSDVIANFHASTLRQG